MKQRILSIMFILVFLCTTVLFALPVQAGPPEDVPRGKSEQLPPGWQRLNPHTKAHKIKTEIRQGKKYAIYEAEIESLPTTLDDNKTLIDTNWYLQTDISGQSWFQTGVNLFTAKVLEGRVSVEDENGRLSIWDSRITIGNEVFSGGIAEIVNDPINENYKGNCLLWEYGDYSNGWWIFGDSAPVERYLRVLEGYIAELWILPIDPRADVIIDLNESAESAFGARIVWLNAYDANNRPLQVTKDKSGSYVIKAFEFKDKEFPVTIDPSEFFHATADDGEVMYYGTSYATVRTKTTGYVYDTNTANSLGQLFVDGTYQISRFAAMWDTSVIPNSAVITYGKLYLSYGEDYSDTDFYITIQSGMPTYPHKPLVAGDYYYTNYSGNGGRVHTSDPGYYIPLNSTGMSWINKTGWTKFMIRSSRDIAGNTPTGDEYIRVKTREYGLSYAPQLYVVWTEPVDLPTVSTMEASLVSSTQATLEGYLSDDGGDSCSVRFQYGTSTSYGNVTAWVSGKTTGNYFNKTVYGLTPGTTYHFRAQAINSAGTSSGADKTFVTPPNAPYNFTATAGDTEIDLTWTKGAGADKTRILGSAIGYPTSPYGDPVYFDTGTSHTVTDLTNGTKIYFSAWSESSGVYSTTYVKDSATPSGPDYPTVITNAATDVATTTAILNLYLGNLGGYTSADVWFQYYTGAGTWTDNETTPVTKYAPCSYSKGISGLSTGQLYYFRAAAQNTFGTSYGDSRTFTTETIKPTVTTNAATKLGYESATLNLTLTDDGGEDCEVSFEYGLTTEYGSTTPWIPGYSSSDGYLYNLSSLDSNTTYHFRGRARNGNGVGYGGDLTFDTLAAPPDVPTCQTNAADYVGYATATLHGKVTNDGGESCVTRFQYGFTVAYGTDTEWVDGYVTNDLFQKVISSLDSNTTYHFRAQVKNSAGTGDGNDLTFVTDEAPPSMPTVGTHSATDVGSTTATLHAVLSNDGGETCQARFEYGFTDAYGTYTEWQDGFITNDEPEQAIVGLNTETLYHFRAIAKNSAGESYGSDMVFTTGEFPVCAPTMTTQAATGVQLNSATLNGVVTDDGGATCTVWFEWGLTTSYGNSTPTISGLSTSDIFYYGLTNLEPSTTYHYRAMGQNSAGIGFGGDQSFLTTAPSLPTVRTDAASSVGAYQATLNATVLTDGGVECEVRFQYGLTDAYGTDTEWVAGYTKNQTFNKLISNLTIDETYHFRAQAKNAGGTGSGDDATFTTVFTAPTNFRAKAISSTTINLEWTKSGDGTYIKCKQNGFPIDRADGDPVYLGPEAFSSISGLMAGTTYYFRAWAWAEGDVWADGYADDVGTTQATVPVGEEEKPEMVKSPEEPQTWFQPPSGSAIEKMPFYESFVDLAEHYEIPEGTMWLTIALSATILVPVIAFAVVHKAFVAVVVGGLTIAGCSLLGMAPLWFIAVYAALGGGLIFVTSRM